MQNNKTLKKISQLITGIIIFLFLFCFADLTFAANITVSWNAPTTNVDNTSLTDLDGYYIYYGTKSGVHNKVIDITDETVTTYTISNLVTNKVYYLIMTAYDTTGNESSASSEFSTAAIGIDTTAPNISGVYTNNISTTGATINWTTDEATDAQIEYGLSPSSLNNTNTFDSSLATVHSQTVSGLSSSTTYYYRILSYDNANNAGIPNKKYSFTTTATPDITPPVISNIVITKIKDTSATITWTTDEAATSQVEYGINTSYGNLTTTDTKLVTTHSVKITSLSSYTSYDFRIISQDATNNTVTSANNSFSTSNTSPAIDSFYSDVASGSPSLTVNFTVNASDADGYISTYEWDFTGNGIYVKDTATPYYVYSNIGSFTATVKVTDDGGASTVSKKIKIKVSSSLKTSPTLPSAPTPQIPKIIYVSPTIPATTDKYTVTFTLSVSGDIVLFEWDFDGNGTYDAETTTPTVSYTYKNNGTSSFTSLATIDQYTVKVRVTTREGATATTETSVDLNTIPVAESVVTSNDTSGNDGSGGGCFISLSAQETNTITSDTGNRSLFFAITMFLSIVVSLFCGTPLGFGKKSTH